MVASGDFAGAKIKKGGRPKPSGVRVISPSTSHSLRPSRAASSPPFIMEAGGYAVIPPEALDVLRRAVE